MANRSAEQRVQELLDALRIGLDLELAFVGEFTQGKRVFRFVAGGLTTVDIAPGLGDPLEESYCHWIVEGRLPGVIQDARQEPVARALAATERAGIRAHVGIPLRLSDGRIFGSLCAAGTSVRHDLDEHALDYARNFAIVIARELEELLETEIEHDRRFGQVEWLLQAGSCATHLQPIVDLEDGDIVSVEALARFDTHPYRPPNEWFAEAWSVGLGIELELAAARQAARHLVKLDPRVSLAVNVSPATILTPGFIDEFSTYGARLIVEVTEHAAVQDYQKLLQAVEPLTDVGIKLAVDDVGAGYASLSHILELSPDVVKLDISLTKEIDRDVARLALVAALVTFTNQIGARLIAEGIETKATQHALRKLGVRFGQGYLFGRPAPAETVTAELAAYDCHIAV